MQNKKEKKSFITGDLKSSCDDDSEEEDFEKHF